jgi:FkbH-like protein
MTMTYSKEEERIAFFKGLFAANQLSSKSAAEVLSLSSKFSKVEASYIKENGAAFRPKRIALLGSYTTYQLMMMLKIHLFAQGINPVFYEGLHDGIVFEIMNKESALYSFKPDVLLLLTHHMDIKSYPRLFATEDEINSWKNSKLEHYKSLWNIARELKGCQVLQSLFVSPPHRQLGNLEANYLFSQSNCLKRLNIALIESRPSNVTFIDMEHIAYTFGKKYWFDESNYFISKQGYSFEAAKEVSYALSRIITSLAGKTKKCLVLDLDNTLWGGEIGDDGLEGIRLNPNNPLGEAYLSFQKYIKELKNRGVILAVCSKNESSIAKQPFYEHPDMFLKLDDIACFVANWDDKPNNLKQIAQQLNIGLDSLVFFDDNPAEREIVRQFTPEVEVINIPEDPALYVRALEEAMCFEWLQLSDEDIRRSDSYVLDNKRLELQSQSIDYESYLQSLEMKSKVGRIGSFETPRFVQLINKSNQFNLRVKRYDESYINQLKDQPDEWALLCVNVTDKFSNYGIMSSIIVQKVSDKAFVDTWVMSCRVLKRGVENLALNLIFDTARRWGCEWVVGEYLPTKKNKLVSNLYRDFGFEDCSDEWLSDINGNGKTYRIKLSECRDKSHHIETCQLEN